MRPPHFRVRTLMIVVALSGLLFWGGWMVARSFVFARRASEYGAQERGWREVVARGPGNDPAMWKFAGECAEYFGGLTRTYRRATWRPWTYVGPDPHAPGYDRWVEQERRKKEATDPGALAAPRPGGL